MQNPQTCDLDPRTIYQYDTHTNIPWNDPDYQPVREYIDPMKQICDRKYAAQKKGQKDTRYVTKKGFYMDYHLKVVKALPAPSIYNLGDPWDQTSNKKEGEKHKIDPKLTKNTYIEQIETEEKNRKKPAPGAYNLNKTDAEIKEEGQKMRTRKISTGARRYFYEETEHLSGLHPGPGANNPHFELSHLHLNKTDHKFWIGKHKKDSEYWQKKRSASVGPGSYSASPLEYSTFDRIATGQKKRLKSENKNGFGSDAKFPYDRVSKKKIVETRPSSFTYNLMIQWKGKNMELRKNNWIRTRSTGFNTDRSVYR